MKSNNFYSNKVKYIIFNLNGVSHLTSNTGSRGNK